MPNSEQALSEWTTARAGGPPGPLECPHTPAASALARSGRPGTPAARPASLASPHLHAQQVLRQLSFAFGRHTEHRCGRAPPLGPPRMRDAACASAPAYVHRVVPPRGSAPVFRASAWPALFARRLRERSPSEEAQGRGAAAKAGVTATWRREGDPKESWPLSAFPEGFDRAPQAAHRLSAARLTDPVLPRRPSHPGETFEIVATAAVAPTPPTVSFTCF